MDAGFGEDVLAARKCTDKVRLVDRKCCGRHGLPLMKACREFIEELCMYCNNERAMNSR